MHTIAFKFFGGVTILFSMTRLIRLTTALLLLLAIGCVTTTIPQNLLDSSDSASLDTAQVDTKQLDFTQPKDQNTQFDFAVPKDNSTPKDFGFKEDVAEDIGSDVGNDLGTDTTLSDTQAADKTTQDTGSDVVTPDQTAGDSTSCNDDPWGGPTWDDLSVQSISLADPLGTVVELTTCQSLVSDWLLLAPAITGNHDFYVTFSNAGDRFIDIYLFEADSNLNIDPNTPVHSQVDLSNSPGINSFSFSLESTKQYFIQMQAVSKSGPYRLRVNPPCSKDTDCRNRLAKGWLYACDNGVCRECLNNTHCTANPDSLGGTCNTTDSYCTVNCNTEDVCAGNPNGFRCIPGFLACGCETDTDCPQGSTCQLQVATDNYYLYGWRLCIPIN